MHVRSGVPKAEDALVWIKQRAAPGPSTLVAPRHSLKLPLLLLFLRSWQRQIATAGRPSVFTASFERFRDLCRDRRRPRRRALANPLVSLGATGMRLQPLLRLLAALLQVFEVPPRLWFLLSSLVVRLALRCRVVCESPVSLAPW